MRRRSCAWPTPMSRRPPGTKYFLPEKFRKRKRIGAIMMSSQHVARTDFEKAPLRERPHYEITPPGMNRLRGSPKFSPSASLPSIVWHSCRFMIGIGGIPLRKFPEPGGKKMKKYLMLLALFIGVPYPHGSGGLPPALAKFPEKEITLVCPWPPGGSSDLITRTIAKVGAKYFPKPIIVINKAGRQRGCGHNRERSNPGRWIHPHPGGDRSFHLYDHRPENGGLQTGGF